MFRKTLHSFVFLLFATAIYAQQKDYTVEGTIHNSYDGKLVYLQILNEKRNGLLDVDSTIVKNGQFTFKGHDASDAAIRFITTATPMTYQPALFVPQQGTINVSIGDTVVVGGTYLNNNYQKFVDNQYHLNQKIQKEITAYSEKKYPQTAADYEESVQLVKPIVEEMAKARFEFAQENIESELGEYIALTSFEMLPPGRILELVSQMRPEFRNSSFGKEVLDYYTAENIIEPGNKYKDLELADPLGNAVKLSDYVGKHKVVLVDFWASWCGPCIKEMPIIVEAYEKYKSKGLEIVGLSLDSNQQAWLRAIDRFGITWPQMSDLKGWESNIASVYGIKSIPMTLLLDENGTIIASQLRGDDLIKKIGELLD